MTALVHGASAAVAAAEAADLLFAGEAFGAAATGADEGRRHPLPSPEAADVGADGLWVFDAPAGTPIQGRLRREAEGVIEVHPDYRSGLADLEGFTWF